MDVFGRYRNLVILMGVLFLQVLGLAVQVKRSGSSPSNDAHDTRLIRIWAVGAITPFERGLVWIENSTGNIWHNYFYLRGVRAENRQLKQQIEQMRIEQVRLSEDATQARRLQTLLAFKEQFISKTVAAQVIGTSGSDLSRIIYIDKGDNEGLKRDMAVVTADGIVGKVLQVYPSVAQVLLINDQSSGVGVILEKTRLQGVLRGTANGEVALERVMSDEQVAEGETILTSGGDRIFPKGLPVGTVAKVAAGKDLFLNIKVRSAADLSKLEEVLVLVEKQDREATAEDTTRVRAADILAQRLPTVPEKPATANDADAAGAGTKPGVTVSPAAANHGAIVQTPGVQTPTLQKTAQNAAVLKTSVPKTAVQKTAADGSDPKNDPGTGAAVKPTSVAPRIVAPKTAAPTSADPKTAKPSPPQTDSQPPTDADSPH
jgi:rod shape-determining protein MreC